MTGLKSKGCLVVGVALVLFVGALDSGAMTAAEARALFKDAPTTDSTTPYHPNPDPGAQWFPEAGFGLFTHWGMFSCEGLRPSWGILNNRFSQKAPRDIGVEEYYALAKQFNPQHYNPDEWMDMAKSLGMQYVVLTTKHHDGFCLWPSEYGDYNTKCGAGGRDLLKEYVEAARRHGLKVGFYFSPRDWGYNHHISGFPETAQNFDRENPMKLPFPEEQNRAEYLKWIDYTVGQLSELMTRYGKIDLLWFDGSTWIGDVPDHEYGNKIRNWIYTLQPSIVINPRWGEVTNPDYAANTSADLKKIRNATGDFYTFESKWSYIVDPQHNVGVYEPIWFEFCDIWKGWHWGFDRSVPEKVDPAQMKRVLERLSTLRAFGGNYLLNVGPDGDGQLRSDVVDEAKILSKWIQPRRAAFFGVQPVKHWEKVGSVPLTRNGNLIYVHLTGEKLADVKTVELAISEKPLSARMLGSGAEVKVEQNKAGLLLELPTEGRDPLGAIVEVEFKDAKEALR